MVQLDQTKRLDFIDGLRALAIIGVVGFHVGVPGFSGGFTGVDIFFVISGFVIGGQIIDRLGKNSLSLREFYAHRILRIFPPLFLVLAVGASVIFLLPVLANQVRAINTSAAAAAAMISNQYFVVHSGYFDLDSADQPYLHTWSLGVEEQFYIFVPVATLLMFLAASRLRKDPLALTFAGSCVAFCASLLLGLYLAPKGGRFPFYGMPTRVWEFEAGVLVMLANRLGLTPTLAPRYAEAVGLSGVAAVCAAVALIEPTAVFPSMLSGLPVVGTALLLWAGSSQPRCGVFRILALPPLVLIGLLSYSWYLWHWPVLFSVRTLNLGDHSIPRDLFGAALAFALAGFTYWVLERPCRRLRHLRLSAAHLNAILMSGVLGLLLVAAAVFGSAQIANRIWQRSEFDPFRLPILPPFKCASDSGHTSGRCSATSSGPQQAVVWGDSHAAVFWPAVREAAITAGVNAELDWRVNCPPVLRADFLLNPQDIAACDKHNQRVVGRLVHRESGTPVGVVLLGFWIHYLDLDQSISFAPTGHKDSRERQFLLLQIETTIDKLAASGLRVLVVAPVPSLAHRAPECLYAAAVLNMDERLCGVSRASINSVRIGILDAIQRKVAEYSNVRMIDPADVLCNDELCPAGRKNLPLYSDTNHLSAAGASMVVAHFKDSFEWSFGR